MNTSRVILHADINNFYASVEVKENPALKGLPVAVSGNPKLRHGVILAKNDIAKAKGIRTGDVIWEAKQKEPGLILVPPRFNLYMQYSEMIFNIYTRYTNLVEAFGPDECWLDVTGSIKMFGSGETIADALRKTVREETGLTVSVGVSFNKVLAKLGSDLKKPDATTLLSPENFKDRIWHLPARELFFVGRRTEEKLKKLNIRTIGDIARADTAMLKNHFGIVGERLQNYALGKDTDPVREYVKSREAESVGHGMTTTEDVVTMPQAESVIFYLSELVGARLRRNRFKGGGIHLAIRSSSSLSTCGKQKKLAAPTCAAAEIAREAGALLKEIWDGEPLRTISVSVFHLETEGENDTQLSLFADIKSEKQERLERGIDAIRKKYGGGSIINGSIMGKEFLYNKTESEDFLPFKR